MISLCGTFINTEALVSVSYKQHFYKFKYALFNTCSRGYETSCMVQKLNIKALSSAQVLL